MLITSVFVIPVGAAWPIASCERSRQSANIENPALTLHDPFWQKCTVASKGMTVEVYTLTSPYPEETTTSKVHVI
jgi:hypothetical protein